MVFIRTVVVLGAVLGVVVAPTAQAGTVTRSQDVLTYQADPAATSGEGIGLSTEAGRIAIGVDRGVTSSDCEQDGPNRVLCDPAALLVLRLTGFDDGMNTASLAGATALEVHAGIGADSFDGTENSDRLFGEDGDDTIVGKAGSDRLEGGAGADGLTDGIGDDTVHGGPGDDRWTAGTGRDTYSGGDGSDVAYYDDRVAALTLTLDGQPDDGEAGEGDNLGADVENARGGSGADTITGNGLENELLGNAGNDTIVAGASADRVDAGEGDDSIDTRDGGYDSVECGPGNDVVYADPDDGTTNCEVAPDADGDRYNADVDCWPNDPSRNPGAGEVVGNDVDENCDGRKEYRFVVNRTSAGKYKVRRRPFGVRIRSLFVDQVQAGDLIEVRCTGGGCPFARRTRTGTGRISLVRLLKKRYLKRGAVVEIRHARPNEVAKVVRLSVRRSKVETVTLCLWPGETAVRSCAS